ncbi:MAG: hypothetical protein AABW80_03805 [Nanoarchaeota archaeon]
MASDFLESLNDRYASEKMYKEMGEHFKANKEKALKLNEFLKEDSYGGLKELLERDAEKKKIANRFSFEEMGIDKKIECIFADLDFLDFAGAVVGRKIKKGEIKVKRFKHRDYTLLHDSDDVKPGIVFFFFICSGWNGEYGGEKVYLGGKQPLICMPEPNTFYLLKKQEGVREFVRYVNNLAGKNAFIIVEGKLE